jgi:hypothetical protein
MRIQNEQSGSSSLFAQPLAIEAIPEEAESTALNSDKGTTLPTKPPRGLLESRMEAALGALSASHQAPSAAVRQGHMALLKRWYYRPEVKRAGEIFFPGAEGHWAIKALLRGAGRIAAHMLTASPPP